MFTCSNIAAAQAKNYYKLDDYYHEKGLVPSRVLGSAAERLGLNGDFDSAKFNDALHGRFPCNPIERANTPSLQRAGFDCTFSAPKSVSIEALVHGKGDVILAHQEAVDAAMREVQNLVKARVTKNFVTSAVSAEVVYFNFRHETSRNVVGELPDPNLHDHNVILGQVLVKMADGKEKLYALDNKEIFQAQKLLDAVYKQNLARGLRRLGYELELTKNGFEIAGYSREQIDIFSKRKLEVDINLAKQGLSRAASTIKQRDMANMKDRNRKQTFSRLEMRSAWNRQSKFFSQIERKSPNDRYVTAAGARSAESQRSIERSIIFGYRRSTIAVEPELGLTRRRPPPAGRGSVRDLSAIDVVHNARRREMLLQGDVQLHLDDGLPDRNNTLRRLDGRGGQINADDAVAVAIRHFSERHVAIRTRHDLAEFAIRAAEFDFPLDQVQHSIDRAIVKGDLVQGRNGKALVFAQAHADELAIAALYRAGIEALLPAATKEQALVGIKKMEASMSMRRVADVQSAQGRTLHSNELENLKVTLSAKQVAMIEKIASSTDRFNVIVGDAGTGKSTGMEAAKLVLEERGFTVKGLAPSGTAVQALAEAGLNTKTVQHAFHNPKYWDNVNEKTVLVLDEAGLVDAKTMRYVQERVEERQARLVIVGDPKQYGSVNRGTAMAQLCSIAQSVGTLVNLDQMQRGRNETMRELHFSARDSPEESLDFMFKNQMVTSIQNERDRLKRIAEMYVEIDTKDKKSALVLTGKNADRIKINSAIREQLGLENGHPINSIEMIDATAEATKLLATYERGDFIKLNRKFNDWRAGTTLLVIDKAADSIVVRDREGIQNVVHPREFGGMVSVGQVEQIEVAIGERVRFTAGDAVKEILNGDRGEVSRIDNGMLFIKLDRSGVEVSLALEKDAPLPLRYAYAQTGHSAQGATAKMVDAGGKVPNVILCTNADDSTVDARSWYTNVTRAADKVHLVTNATTARQIEAVRRRIATPRAKDTAEELLNGTQQLKPYESRNAFVAPAKGDRAWERIKLPMYASSEQIEVVLALAHSQYGRDLFVDGPKDVQTKVARTAGRLNMDVAFEDKALDSVRQQYLPARDELHQSAALTPVDAEQRPRSVTAKNPIREIFEHLPRDTTLSIVRIDQSDVLLRESKSGKDYIVALTDDVRNRFKASTLKVGSAFEINAMVPQMVERTSEHKRPAIPT